MHVHVHTYMCVRVHVHMNMCMYVYMCMHTHCVYAVIPIHTQVIHYVMYAPVGGIWMCWARLVRTKRRAVEMEN